MSRKLKIEEFMSIYPADSLRAAPDVDDVSAFLQTIRPEQFRALTAVGPRVVWVVYEEEVDDASGSAPAV